MAGAHENLATVAGDRQVLSRRARLVVLVGISLLLSAQLQASPPSILDDPGMAPGTSILSDPVPLCGPGQTAAYDPGVDIYGRPVAPADTQPPVAVEAFSDVIQPEIFHPAAGPARIHMQLELQGLTAALQSAPCQPAPRDRRNR